MYRFGSILFALLLGAGFVGCAETYDRASSDRASLGQDAGVPQELSDRVYAATVVFRELTQRAPDQEIPSGLLETSRCVAVLPSVVEAAFVVGGTYGQGVASCRTSGGGWSPPAFVSIAGGSIGWQAGAEQSQLLMFFTNDKAFELLSGPEFRIGADIEATAGPVGRQASASTGRFLEDVYVYGSSKGLFAGVSINGSRIAPNSDANRAYYGGNARAEEILRGEVARVPAAAREFRSALS